MEPIKPHEWVDSHHPSRTRDQRSCRVCGLSEKAFIHRAKK